MYAAEPKARKAAPVEPCAICGEPSSAALWEHRVCAGCLTHWTEKSPPLEPLELAHAALNPGDVEAHGVHQFVDKKPWVILKPGVGARLAKASADRWVTERSKAMRRSA